MLHFTVARGIALQEFDIISEKKAKFYNKSSTFSRRISWEIYLQPTHLPRKSKNVEQERTFCDLCEF